VEVENINQNLKFGGDFKGAISTHQNKLEKIK
jgi:hypothetical protein